MARNVARAQSQLAMSVLASVAVSCFVIAILYWARAILIPLALAILLSFVLSPLVIALQRRRFGRVPSVLLVVTAAIVVIGGVTVVVVDQTVDLIKTLPDHSDRIKAKLASIKALISGSEQSRFGNLVNDLSEMFDPGGPQAVVVNSSPPWVSRVQDYLSPAAEVVGQAAFTFILVVFMLLRREDLRNRMIRLLGQGRLTATTKAVDETSRRISRYLLAQFGLNAAFGLVITLGLVLLSVPYAPLWGVIAFLMRYVPYVGTWIGVIPPALFTVAISDGWWTTLGVLILFIGLELLCNNIVEPMLYGPRLGLSEVAQLVATAFWALLWGPVGMILAWPLTTCLLTLGKYVPPLRFLNVLLGDEPVLSPRHAFYQRLAARDQDEATEIAEKELVDRPIEQVLDDLLIPALSQARHDAWEGLLSDDDLAFVTRATAELAEEVIESRPDLPSERARDRVRVLLLPSRNSVDHAAANLLARILDASLWEVEVAPAMHLASELMEQAGTARPAIIVVVSVVPGGVTRVRYLCKLLRANLPDLKIIAARLPESPEEASRSAVLIRNAGADEITATLEETRTLLHGWRSVYATGTVTPANVKSIPSKAESAPIGTAPA